MKSNIVRIEDEQATILHDAAAHLAGCTFSAMVKRGVQLFIEQELPVYLEAASKLEGQGVPVVPARIDPRAHSSPAAR